VNRRVSLNPQKALFDKIARNKEGN
jgi:hypothetical protein